MTGEAYSRGAWIEVDIGRLRENFRRIREDLPAHVKFLSVVKAGGYGHGDLEVAGCALEHGAYGLGVATMWEAARLRREYSEARIFQLANPVPEDIPHAVELRVTLCPGQIETLEMLQNFGKRHGITFEVHLKVNTGMNRYGLRWDEAGDWARILRGLSHVRVAGVYSHFAMSDELDKTSPRLQMARFSGVVEAMDRAGVDPGLRHLCNSGGMLDLPDAHWDMVRIGLLPLGVFPSKVCRRIPDIHPVLSVKARISALQRVAAGETVGYGLRYTAPSPRRIGIVPVGYGDGFPRVRNEGAVLVHGRRVPIVGSVAMDAFAVDVTPVDGLQLYDEVVLLGRQGDEEIRAEELAALKKSVTYDLLAGWRGRLPRRRVGGGDHQPIPA